MDSPTAVEDAAAQPDLWLAPLRAPKDKPHYVGHRERLRERAAAGGLAGNRTAPASTASSVGLRSGARPRLPQRSGRGTCRGQ